MVRRFAPDLPFLAGDCLSPQGGVAMDTIDDDGGLKVVRDTPTLRDRTTQKLRDAIIGLKFTPGEHLVERDLCERTGVSRSSVREALRHLEAEGLIERRGGRGLFVASVTIDEARQIYEVRAALEPEMARLFCERASQEHLDALADALADIERALASKDKDIGGYVKGLNAFYDAIMWGSGNEIARRILRTLHARVAFLRSVTAAKAPPGRERETLRLMRAIAAAVRSRKSDLAAERSRSFVERSAEFAIEVLANQAAATSGS
jgi:GntR family transcriptional regulator, trigonelline degradation regulator